MWHKCKLRVVGFRCALYKCRGGRQTAPVPGTTPHEWVGFRLQNIKQLALGGGRTLEAVGPGVR